MQSPHFILITVNRIELNMKRNSILILIYYVEESNIRSHSYLTILSLFF